MKTLVLNESEKQINKNKLFFKEEILGDVADLYLFWLCSSCL